MSERHAKATDPLLNSFRGAIRRLVITKAAAFVWDMLGVQLTPTNREPVRAEVFHGIGFAALPSRDGSPEAIVLNVAAATAPVVIASRDIKGAKIAGVAGMKTGETMVYSEKAIIYMRDDGHVEVRTPSGTALSLATKADVTALANFVQGLAVGGTGSAPIPPGSVPQPTGTTVLRGQ